MGIVLNPYINFKDNAREAMEFYRDVFGAKLTTATFADFHASQDPAEDNLIMHADLEAPDGLRFMASDTPSHLQYQPGTNFSMSLSGDAGAESELRGYFDKLADGGTIDMPMEKAAWGDTFGMCTDRFGVRWLFNIAAPTE
jgi:PhnB protein